MSLIPNLRTRNGSDPVSMAFGPCLSLLSPPSSTKQGVRPQRYVDTPQIIYSEWNKNAGGIRKQLGTLPSDFEICLIGGGISNVIAALELRKAGAKVTLIEARAEVGGRTRSAETPDGVNIAEMGAMRFPPSEDILYYYAKAFHFTFLSNFPDPGKVPTLVSYRGSPYTWVHPAEIPPGFKTVYFGWVAFIREGVVAADGSGKKVLQSAEQLTEWLQPASTPEERAKVILAWQDYLNIFRSDNFRAGLERIFGQNHDDKWEVPGGEVWTDDDFERFGALGLGSGGFGPLYPAGFNSVFRLVANSLETDQATFAKCVGDKCVDAKPAAIQDLTRAIWKEASSLGVTTKFNTTARVLDSVIDKNGWPRVTVEEDGVASPTHYNLVIVGTTIRAMDVKMSLTSYQPDASCSWLLDPATGAAVNNTHMTSSSKLFIRTRKFWENMPRDFPRDILSDTKAPQLYTLDYGHEEFGMVLVTYTWEDLSNQLMAVGSNADLLDMLKRQIRDIMAQTKYKKYADDYLVPVESDDDIYTIHWQLEPEAHGAFTFAHAGEDKGIARMFYDFEKLRTGHEGNMGVLINSDCTSFHGGWIDGGLQTVMNNLSAVLKKYGTLKAAKYAPVNLIKSGTYTY